MITWLKHVAFAFGVMTGFAAAVASVAGGICLITLATFPLHQVAGVALILVVLSAIVGTLGYYVEH